MADYLSTAFTPPGSEQHLNDNLTWANQFTMLATVSATRISWYTTASGGQPKRIRLWRVSDGVSLVDQAITGGATGAGWHSNTFTAVTLTAGESYVVGVSTVVADGVNWFITYWSTSAPQVDANYQHAGIRFGVGTAGGPIPTFTSSAQMAGVFIGDGGGYTPAGVTTGGGFATPTDVANTVRDWLVTGSENAHQTDGLPWRTDANVTTVKNEAEGVNGFAAIKAVADAIASAVGGIPGTIAAAVTTIMTKLIDMTGNTAQTGIATIGAVSHDLAGVENHLIDAVLGQGTFPTGGGTLLWTLADETDFDTTLAWAVQADLYVFSVTSPPPTMAADSFGGVAWYHRLGSWAPLNGDQIAGQRGFVEFGVQQLHQCGYRMPGLALVCKPGTLGHVQAWLLA